MTNYKWKITYDFLERKLLQKYCERKENSIEIVPVHRVRLDRLLALTAPSCGASGSSRRVSHSGETDSGAELFPLPHGHGHGRTSNRQPRASTQGRQLWARRRPGPASREPSIPGDLPHAHTSQDATGR